MSNLSTDDTFENILQVYHKYINKSLIIKFINNF